MATQDLWNIRGQQWLDTLEDIAANADPEDPASELTQLEKTIMDDLKRMVVRPEAETPPPQPSIDVQKRADGFRTRALEFLENDLDENEWGLDETPIVSLSEDGAFVQFWRWFNEDD